MTARSRGSPCPAADVGSNRRRAQCGGDSHAFLDVVDRLRAHRRIWRGHLPAELEVDELHADRVRRGADALRVGDRALVEVVDDDLELGAGRAPRGRTSARRVPSSPPAPAAGIFAFRPAAIRCRKLHVAMPMRAGGSVWTSAPSAAEGRAVAMRGLARAPAPCFRKSRRWISMDYFRPWLPASAGRINAVRGQYMPGACRLNTRIIVDTTARASSRLRYDGRNGYARLDRRSAAPLDRQSPSRLRSQRGRLQHRLGHSRLPRRRGRVEAAAAGHDPAFRTQEAVYRRYWARAYAGWPRLTAAAPNAAHRAFAAWEAAGTLFRLVTQNVDRLHQRAGSRAVIDLHGRLDVVVCLSCGDRSHAPPCRRRWLPPIRSGGRRP